MDESKYTDSLLSESIIYKTAKIFSLQECIFLFKDLHKTGKFKIRPLIVLSLGTLLVFNFILDFYIILIQMLIFLSDIINHCKSCVLVYSKTEKILLKVAWIDATFWRSIERKFNLFWKPIMSTWSLHCIFQSKTARLHVSLMSGVTIIRMCHNKCSNYEDRSLFLQISQKVLE